MRLIRNFRINRAAKKYASELPPALLEALGERKYYTACQIKTVARSIGLNTDFLVLGYACFLPQERFASESEGLKVMLGYDEARAVMVRHMPLKPVEN